MTPTCRRPGCSVRSCSGPRLCIGFGVRRVRWCTSAPRSSPAPRSSRTGGLSWSTPESCRQTLGCSAWPPCCVGFYRFLPRDMMTGTEPTNAPEPAAASARSRMFCPCVKCAHADVELALVCFPQLSPSPFYNKGKKTKWRRPVRDRTRGFCGSEDGCGAAADQLLCSHFVFVLICSRLDRKIKTRLPSSSCCGAVWSKSREYSR